MNFIKRIFNRIFDGILYGLGLCLVLTVAIVMADHYYDPTSNYEITDCAEDCRRYKDCPEEADLELNITSEKISETDFIVNASTPENAGMPRATLARINKPQSLIVAPSASF